MIKSAYFNFSNVSNKIYKLLRPHSKFFVFEFKKLKNFVFRDDSKKKNREHLDDRYLTPTNSSVFLLLIELAGLEVGVLVEHDQKEDECRGNDERGDEHGVEDARLRPGAGLLLLLGLRDSLKTGLYNFHYRRSV
jgi:hypothetical protein